MPGFGPVMGQHPRGERVDVVGHACPECPIPTTALWLPPRPDCRWCHGSGIVTTATLARWQAHALETV